MRMLGRMLVVLAGSLFTLPPVAEGATCKGGQRLDSVGRCKSAPAKNAKGKRKAAAKPGKKARVAATSPDRGPLYVFIESGGCRILATESSVRRMQDIAVGGTVSWDGKCADGLISGTGVLRQEGVFIEGGRSKHFAYYYTGRANNGKRTGPWTRESLERFDDSVTSWTSLARVEFVDGVARGGPKPVAVGGANQHSRSFTTRVLDPEAKRAKVATEASSPRISSDAPGLAKSPRLDAIPPPVAVTSVQPSTTATKTPAPPAPQVTASIPAALPTSASPDRAATTTAPASLPSVPPITQRPITAATGGDLPAVPAAISTPPPVVAPAPTPQPVAAAGLPPPQPITKVSTQASVPITQKPAIAPTPASDSASVTAPRQPAPPAVATPISAAQAAPPSGSSGKNAPLGPTPPAVTAATPAAILAAAAKPAVSMSPPPPAAVKLTPAMPDVMEKQAFGFGTGCYMDTLDGQLWENAVLAVKDRKSLRIDGWAVDDEERVLAEATYLRLEGANGRRYYAATSIQERPDVARHLGVPAFVRSGYRAVVSAEDLPPGEYEVAIVMNSKGRNILCGNGRRLKL